MCIKIWINYLDLSNYVSNCQYESYQTCKFNFIYLLITFVPFADQKSFSNTVLQWVLRFHILKILSLINLIFLEFHFTCRKLPVIFYSNRHLASSFYQVRAVGGSVVARQGWFQQCLTESSACFSMMSWLW